MSEQVIKTVENVDKLFSQIIVNGETFISDKVVVTPKPETTAVAQPVVKKIPKASTAPKASRTGEDVYAVDLNDVLHNFTDRTTKQNLTEEIRNRTEKDTAMQTELNAITAEVSSAKSEIRTVKASVDDIKDLIPNQASEDNQLADKDFVNSSVSTNTANFLGTFNTLEEIESLTDVTNNDYAFWKTTDTLGSVVFKRYKYSADEQEWKFEYDLNNSSFTAEQWEAINSGITAELVEKIGDGSAIVPSITEAEYEEIPDKNDGQIREITDAPDTPIPFATLNDSLMTSTNVLSALKTKSMVDDVPNKILNFFTTWEDITNECTVTFGGTSGGNKRTEYILFNPYLKKYRYKGRFDIGHEVSVFIRITDTNNRADMTNSFITFNVNGITRISGGAEFMSFDKTSNSVQVEFYNRNGGTNWDTCELLFEIDCSYTIN